MYTVTRVSVNQTNCEISATNWSFNWLFFGPLLVGLLNLVVAGLGLQFCLLAPFGGLLVRLSLSVSLFMATGTAALYLSSRNYLVSWNWGPSRMPLSCSNLLWISALVNVYLLFKSCKVRYVKSSLHFFMICSHEFLNFSSLFNGHEHLKSTCTG